MTVLTVKTLNLLFGFCEGSIVTCELEFTTSFFVGGTEYILVTGNPRKPIRESSSTSLTLVTFPLFKTESLDKIE